MKVYEIISDGEYLNTVDEIISFELIDSFDMRKNNRDKEFHYYISGIELEPDPMYVIDFDFAACIHAIYISEDYIDTYIDLHESKVVNDSPSQLECYGNLIKPHYRNFKLKQLLEII